MDILWHLYYKLLYFVNNPQFLQSFFDNRFYLILLVVILMRFKYTTYRSMWLSAMVNIPGTFLHELMHYLVGALFNARPCNFTLFPKKNENGDYVMGSVGFQNITYYNAVPAAMAPFLLLPIGFYLNRHMLPVMAPTFSNYVLYVLLQTIIVENAIPSSVDFKVAGMYLRGVIMYGALIFLYLLYV